MNSINHILPSYAKFIIWALDNTVSFKKDEDKRYQKRHHQDHMQLDFEEYKRPQDLDLLDLDELLNLHYVH